MQDTVLVADPTHVFPLFCGAGLLQNLVSVLVPVPQVTLHGLDDW